jgi:dimethylglycine dehydrogenase
MIEAGMARFVNFEKGDFVGREALLRRREQGAAIQLVYLSVEAGDADPLGNEPVIANGRIVGVTTSGGFGHAVGQSLAFAYVEAQYAAPSSAVEVSILGKPRPARVLAEPAYDPGNERLKS